MREDESKGHHNKTESGCWQSNYSFLSFTFIFLSALAYYRRYEMTDRQIKKLIVWVKVREPIVKDKQIVGYKRWAGEYEPSLPVSIIFSKDLSRAVEILDEVSKEV